MLSRKIRLYFFTAATTASPSPMVRVIGFSQREVGAVLVTELVILAIIAVGAQPAATVQTVPLECRLPDGQRFPCEAIMQVEPSTKILGVKKLLLSDGFES